MEQRSKVIPVIDIFAGPGGLGEGFSAYRSTDESVSFRVVLSIEKDVMAHRTLELRAFFREFPPGEAPPLYYEYLAGKTTREKLFEAYPDQSGRAEQIAWHAELGAVDDAEVDRRIRRALEDAGEKEWMLIGGPPCQAYSLIGRARMSKSDPEEFEQDPRHRLYQHYLRILAEHRPTVFIMENVKGILSSKLNGERIFEHILRDLQSPAKAVGRKPCRAGSDEYHVYSLVKPVDSQGEMFWPRTSLRPEDYLIKSEDFGIPQTRHRVILLGIRKDFAGLQRIRPEQVLLPADAAGRMTVAEAISDLPSLRSGLSRERDSYENWRQVLREGLRPEVFEGVNEKVLGIIHRTIEAIAAKDAVSASISVPMPEKMKTWFLDDKLHGVCNHDRRNHMREDLYRYLFASVFARVEGYFPRLKDYPVGLLPQHRNVEVARNSTSNFCDRFRVQMANEPGTTITSHIAKDGHYYIHYDPEQCRSLTVREAARLQTFPDNYFFEGTRTQQYTQVGNAVPPRLAFLIAGVVAGLLMSAPGTRTERVISEEPFPIRELDLAEALMAFDRRSGRNGA